MTRNLVLSALSLLALAASAAAQTAPSPQDLALRDAVSRAIEKNRDVVVERESATLANAGIERAEGAYDPTFRADVPSGTYYVRVRALNDVGESDPSDDVEVRAPGYETLSFDIRIEPGHTTTYRGELQKLPN